MIGGYTDLRVFYVQKEQILAKLALTKKMLSMWLNSGKQDSDFLVCTAVLGPYQRCIQSGRSRTKKIIAVGPDEKNHFNRNGLLYECIKR